MAPSGQRDIEGFGAQARLFLGEGKLRQTLLKLGCEGLFESIEDAAGFCAFGRGQGLEPI
jgi:hypothetical protein